MFDTLLYCQIDLISIQSTNFSIFQIFHYKGGDHFYCGFGPMLRADNSARSCVMQLYQGFEDPTWCQSRLRHGLVQPFTRLYNGSWIFAALHEKFPVNLRCPDGTTRTGLVGFGVISLAEGCTITSHGFWYPHTFKGVIEVNLDYGDRGWDHANFHTDESIHDMMNGSHPHPPDDELHHHQHHHQHHPQQQHEHDRHDVDAEHHHEDHMADNHHQNPDDNYVDLATQVAGLTDATTEAGNREQVVIISNGQPLETRSTMTPEDVHAATEGPEPEVVDIVTLASLQKENKMRMELNTIDQTTAEAEVLFSEDAASKETPRLIVKNGPRFQKQAQSLASAALRLDGDTINKILAEMSDEISQRKLDIGDLETILGTAVVTATSTEDTNVLNEMIVKLSENPQTKWLFGLSSISNGNMLS